MQSGENPLEPNWTSPSSSSYSSVSVVVVTRISQSAEFAASPSVIANTREPASGVPSE